MIDNDSTPFKRTEVDNSLLRGLIIVQIIMGILTIIGCGLAAFLMDEGKLFVILGGISVAMFNFTLATIVMACQKYLNQ